jgi:hypothetical protein
MTYRAFASAMKTSTRRGRGPLPLFIGPGTRLDTPPLTMQVLRVDTVSSNPHHALYDAWALRHWHIEAAHGIKEKNNG